MNRFADTKNTALIVEGGGFRGIYASGILDRFLDEGIHFPTLYGVSMGAITGINYVSDQPRRMLNWCKKYVTDKKYMGFGNLLTEGNFFSRQYGYNQEARRYIPFDIKTFYESEEQFYFVATDVETGEAHYFNKQEYNVIDLCLATSALPVFSQMVEINGKKYLDGGISDSIPLFRPLEDGYEKLVFVLTQPKGYYKSAYNPNFFLRRYYRNYPKLLEAIKNRPVRYNATLDIISELERQGRAFVYRVNEDADRAIIQRNPEIINRNYEFGYRQADIRLEELKKFLKR